MLPAPATLVSIPFRKYEGTANDFVVVDARHGDVPALDPAAVARICDRHRGVGADGVLVIGQAGELPSMTVLNADGSTSEMCGNGLRCVVRYLVGDATSGEITVMTGAGPHRCIVKGELVEVAMRVPSLVPSEVPVVADAPLIDAPIEFSGHRIRFTAVSMGNPHAVTFDPDLDRAVLGPRVGRDPRFPQGVNVGFGRIEGSTLELHVFERGAGFTQACGTGACAAAVAAVVTGRARRGETLEVRLPGGPLAITVGAADEPVRMRGPARFVFEGALDVARFTGEPS